MRKDMQAVVRTRGRVGGWGETGRKTLKLVEGECLDASRESLRRRHRTAGSGKSSQLHLSPVNRFLQSNVGRPWAKVYSELKAGFRKDDSLLHDVLNYLSIETNTALIDGEVVVQSSFGRTFGIEGSLRDYFVHPTSGLLCANTQKVRSRTTATWRAEKALETAQRRRDLGPLLQLHCLKGIWYEVELAEIPEKVTCPQGFSHLSLTECRAYTAAVRVSDVVLKRTVQYIGGHTLLETYGKVAYAKSKRQLSSKELRMHGLVLAQAA